MDVFSKKKWGVFIFGIAVLIAATVYFSMNKFKIRIERPESENTAIAEPMSKDNLSPEAAEHLRKGKSFLKDRKLDKALKEFQAAAKLSPKSPVTHYWVGMIYFYKKEPEKAIAKFQKALEVDPKNYHAMAMLGKIYSFQREKLDMAEDYLKKALAVNMEYLDAHFDLGRVYARKGNISKALSEFRFIFRNESKFAFYHYELGRIFESMNAYDKAKREFQRSLQLDPNFSKAKEALEKLKQ